jgi:tripartite-type tricarboxylate transporter receptor subunit TctC
MKLMKLTALAAMGASLAFASPAFADSDYPSGTIKTIVPFGAGGGTDRWARVMSSVGFDVFGHGMHVQNRGGAGGTIGWKYMMDQKADGHAILMASPIPRRSASLRIIP